MKSKITLYSWRHKNEKLKELGDLVGWENIKEAEWRAWKNNGYIVRITIEKIKAPKGDKK